MDTVEVNPPGKYATARMVTDMGIGIGPEYNVPTVSLGIVPSVVYRIVAPEVVVDKATLCAVAYVPGEGLNVGEATAVLGCTVTSPKILCSFGLNVKRVVSPTQSPGVHLISTYRFSILAGTPCKVAMLSVQALVAMTPVEDFGVPSLQTSRRT